MKNVHTPFFYLAGPMAGQSRRQVTEWRQKLTKLLEANGFGAISPEPFNYDNTPCQTIVETDCNHIRQSAGIIANCYAVSVGTSMEILYAHRLGKEVMVIEPAEGRLSPWIEYHANVIFPRTPRVYKEIIDHLLDKFNRILRA